MGNFPVKKTLYVCLESFVTAIGFLQRSDPFCLSQERKNILEVGRLGFILLFFPFNHPSLQIVVVGKRSQRRARARKVFTALSVFMVH